MTDGTIRQDPEREADPRIDLAIRRTELAEQRTLLAWLRTSLALSRLRAKIYGTCWPESWLP